MMDKRTIATLMGGLAAVGMLVGTSAYGTLYFTPTGSASADIVLGNGTLTATLSSLVQNPTSDGELISGLSFSVSGATAAAALSSASGLISYVDTDSGPNKGTYTAGVASTLPHWDVVGTVGLTTLTGGKPNELIIGPDDAGGFTQGGRYSAANSSISQHNPVVLGSGTFVITIPGITPQSVISDVVFQFGTSGTEVPSVPEPGTVLAGALLLLPFGASAVRILRRRKA